ncbi:hypothetical protein AAVH_30375 [Aphelenchoides avenae]|nr:hypothetical protein AAVH_30375 [Aphelenchus avenae]
MDPALANVHVDYLLVRWCDYAAITPSVFIDTLTSLGSIRDILRISGAHHILPGHVNNLLVDYAAEHGTREVFFPLPGDNASFDVTDESILNFLTAPKNGTTIKKLEISKPNISARFLERLIEAHRSGRITSNFDMKLWGVDVPHPSTNSGLQFTTVDVEHGTAVVFGKEIQLITKFGHTDIEYEGRNAGTNGEEE